MSTPEGQDLDAQFAQWRRYVQRRKAVNPSDVDELEDHLRGTVDELVAAGLRADEAFLIAVKRMGSLDELSREFAREHSDRLWKQLVLAPPPTDPGAARSRRDLYAMLICAGGAALSIKVPELFGISYGGDEDDAIFYALNVSLFALPWLAGLLAWRRRAKPILIAVLVALFAMGAVGANAYRLTLESQSVVLTALHLPIALWLVVGVAYVADDWRSSRRRMDFIRFTGEAFIYYVLIARGADSFRPVAGRGARPAAVLPVRPRPTGPARPVRPATARARGQRPSHRRAGARRDHRPHRRVRRHAEQGGRPRRERHPAGQPRLVGLAAARLPAPTDAIRRA
jgi:hypothetical protein